ncbi:hypothetical protein D9M69_429300 [compost metagenome]
MAPATPARSALRSAKSTMRCDTSEPKTAMALACCALAASFLMAAQTCAWNGSSFSKPKRRSEPAAMPLAICAASMAMVPLPQQGSYSGALATSPVSGFHQPLAASMAAARVSFSGASPLSWRQPRLNSGSPEVSMYSVQLSVVRCAKMRQSGHWVSMLGRTPLALARKRSATASLMRSVAKFRLCSGLCWAVVSILKVCLGVNQISQATPLAMAYRSFSLR